MRKRKTRHRSEASPAETDAGPLDAASRHQEHRLERLLVQLPDRFRTTIRWLRRPSLRWVRMLAGVLLIAGSFLSILPIFGLWMLPLGLMLLADDIAPLRRVRDRVLDWIERRRPHWFNTSDAGRRAPSSTPQSSMHH
jgi:hypothetical protein